MKKIYTLIALSVIAGSASAAGIKAKKIFPVKIQKTENGTAIERLRKASENGSVYRALSEDVSYYNDGSWEPAWHYSRTYDNQGHNTMLDFVMAGREEVDRTVYAYDEYGNNTRLTTSMALSESEPFENTSMTEYTYDSKVTDFQTMDKFYSWNETAWIVDYWLKKEITRDAAGNVTKMQILFYRKSTDELEPVQTTDIEYTDGKASKIVRQERGQSSSGFVWNKIYEISDIEWVRTDGQLVYDLNDDLDRFLHEETSANLLKSLKIHDFEEDIEMQATVTFTGNNGYILKMTTSEGERAEREFTYTDKNGSYEIVTKDDEYTETYRKLFDDHGEITLEETIYEDEEYSEHSATKCTYEYDAATDVMVKYVVSEYDEETEEFVPSMMGEYSDIQNVASVGTVNDSAADSYDVYTAQGLHVMSGQGKAQLNTLAPGLYIVKSGTKVSKHLVK